MSKLRVQGFAISIACAIAAAVLFGLQPGAINNGVRKVSIHLPGPISAVKGIRIFGDYGRSSGDLLEPQEMTLHLADGTSMSMLVRSSSVSARGDITRYVYVRRPMQPVRFQEAVSDMVNTLAQLHIEPDGLMKRAIFIWKGAGDVPGFGDKRGMIPDDCKSGIRVPFHGLCLDVRISPDPGGGWFYLLMFSVLGSDAVPGISPATQPTGAAASEMRNMALEIPCPVSKAAGLDVPNLKDCLQEADWMFPQKLTLHCPDGASLLMEARSSHIFFFNGVVRGIFVRRPMHTLEFKQARSDMLAALDQLHITPDQTMKKVMSSWPDDAPAADRAEYSYQTATSNRVHGLEFTVRFCPDPQGGWYYFLIFTGGTDVDRSGSRPTTQQ